MCPAYILYLNMDDPDLLEYITPEYDLYKKDIQKAYKDAVIETLDEIKFCDQDDKNWEYQGIDSTKDWRKLRQIGLGVAVEQDNLLWILAHKPAGLELFQEAGLTEIIYGGLIFPLYCVLNI